MVIQQGDVVWVEFPRPRGSAPGYSRPAIVLQHDRYNRSKIQTTIVVAITSNVKYSALPGNVRLRKGEAGLSKSSVVNVTQISTVDNSFLTRVIGHVSEDRLLEIWRGVRQVLEPPSIAEKRDPNDVDR
jgi:mRNA interferase MazF